MKYVIGIVVAAVVVVAGYLAFVKPGDVEEAAAVPAAPEVSEEAAVVEDATSI